ncbi:MAG: dihydroorotate dehydrogenase [Promethearchaeota archaeon]|nr:MAG: dihydroorotate dehydrogenase [Candidatus Lokiarchaeota archaeon]
MTDPLKLECRVADLEFPNPLILASGILGVAPSSMLRLARAGIGGITTKSVGPRIRYGYNNPSIIEIDDGTFLNSVGLANPGIDQMILEISEFKKHSTIPLIVSVFGDGPEGFAEIAKLAEKAGCDAIEINISCPHAEVASIALSPELTHEFTHAVKKAVSIPVFAKLTPNIANIIPIAQAAEQAGADAIVAINTLRGLALDYKTGRPLLSHGIGGVSGKAIKSIGVRVIYEIYPHVNIPLIGVGGIYNWQDVLEYVYAGASAVQIGSALYQGDHIFQEINQGLLQFLESEKVSNIMDLRGKAHQYTEQLEGKPKECQ